MGTLIERSREAVVAVGEGAIGLSVRLSQRSVEELPVVGEEVRLWTHLAMREDSWTIYGFATPDERALFRLLISVSGIGPKLALGILSAAATAEIAGFLQSGDEVALAKLPGIGRKSAARLVVELGQRVPATLLRADIGAAVPVTGAAKDANLQSALAVLTAMGLPAGQAEQALLSVQVADAALTADLESWVRAALRVL